MQDLSLQVVLNRHYFLEIFSPGENAARLVGGNDCDNYHDGGFDAEVRESTEAKLLIGHLEEYRS